MWKGDKLAKGRAKWEATARTAVKQCRRPGIPVVDAAEDSRALVRDVRARTVAGGIVLVLHEQEHRGILGLADELRGAREAGVRAGDRSE